MSPSGHFKFHSLQSSDGSIEIILSSHSLDSFDAFFLGICRIFSRFSQMTLLGQFQPQVGLFNLIFLNHLNGSIKCISCPFKMDPNFGSIIHIAHSLCMLLNFKPIYNAIFTTFKKGCAFMVR